MDKSYFGESIPPDSGLLSAIEAHGHVGRIITADWNGKNDTDTMSQILKTNGKAILLIRNPFHAIFSFIDHIEGDHMGHANFSKLIGFGKRQWHLHYIFTFCSK